MSLQLLGTATVLQYCLTCNIIIITYKERKSSSELESKHTCFHENTYTLECQFTISLTTNVTADHQE